jgi:type III restriction enzyme
LGTEKVEAKKAAGVQWCRHALAHAATFNGKPWRWVLIPHDAIVENMTLEVLVGQLVVN